MFLFLAIGGTSFLSKGFKIKGEVLGISQDAYENFSSAIEDVKEQNFAASSVEFSQAYENFSQASEYLNQAGSFLIESSKFFPYVSQLSSGKYMLECGKHISLAGKYINDSAQAAYLLKNSGSIADARFENSSMSRTASDSRSCISMIPFSSRYPDSTSDNCNLLSSSILP